jgi:hypothetical protein
VVKNNQIMSILSVWGNHIFMITKKETEPFSVLFKKTGGFFDANAKKEKYQ